MSFVAEFSKVSQYARGVGLDTRHLSNELKDELHTKLTALRNFKFPFSNGPQPAGGSCTWTAKLVWVPGDSTHYLQIRADNVVVNGRKKRTTLPDIVLGLDEKCKYLMWVTPDMLLCIEPLSNAAGLGFAMDDFSKLLQHLAAGRKVWRGSV